MNTTRHSLHTPAPLAALRGAEGLLQSLMRRLRRAWAEHRQRQVALDTLATLGGLDDRTLHDLGFHRSELPSIASDPYDPTRASRG